MRGGGPSIDRFRRDAAFGMPACAASMSSVRGVRWLMCGPLKAHHIRDQPMGVVQPLVGLGGDRRLAVPAEGLQRFAHELASPRACVRPPCRSTATSSSAPVGKDRRARGWPRLRRAAFVLDQFQPQQRSEDAERIARALRRRRPERGRVDRHAGDREVVVADGMHPHDAKRRRIVTSSRRVPSTNGAMALRGRAAPGLAARASQIPAQLRSRVQRRRRSPRPPVRSARRIAAPRPGTSRTSPAKTSSGCHRK